MAVRMVEMGLVAILVAVLCTGAAAQSACTNTILSLAPCLDYVTGNTTMPSSSCCSQLSTVARSQPECLCLVLNGDTASLGLNINQTLALQLPNACNIQTPPDNFHPLLFSTAAPPAGAPTGSPNTPGNGPNNVPSTDGDSPSASSTTLPSALIVFLLFVASYA